MGGERAVVVTGLGVVSPIGIGRDSFWSALCAGHSGIAPVELFPVPDGGPRLAAEVRGFQPRDSISSTHLRRMDRFSRMVVAAGRMALDDARIAPERVASDSAGVVVGTAYGDISESATYLDRVFTKGPSGASPFIFPNLVLNASASYTAMEFGFTGENLTVAQGEASGEEALIAGCDLIRSGRAEVVLTGGGDELAPILFHVFRRAKALSSQQGGEEWSSPYDVRRNGVVLGEGAAMMVLEPASRALDRGVVPYARIDACAMFGVPAPLYDWPADVRGGVEPLRELLAGSGGAGEVELVCGGANSSRRLDVCEMDLLGRLFGERAPAVALTSIKGAIGEFGGAGALTAVAACLALREQMVPPLCQLRTAAPGAPFEFATGRARPKRIERVLQCGLARGGAGAALLWARW